MPTAVKMTVDEFVEEFHRNPEEMCRYDLHDGEPVMSAAAEPTPFHGELQGAVIYMLRLYAKRHKGTRVFGPVHVEFSPGMYRGPDITMLLPRSETVVTEERLKGVPSLVVEIVSPAKPGLDLIKKRGLYTASKVPEIWFLDSVENEALFLFRQGVSYHEKALKVGLDESPVIRGLRFGVAALFTLDLEKLEASLER